MAKKYSEQLVDSINTVNDILPNLRYKKNKDNLIWLMQEAERAHRLEEVNEMYQFYYRVAYERLEDCENKLNNNKDEDN